MPALPRIHPISSSLWTNRQLMRHQTLRRFKDLYDLMQAVGLADELGHGILGNGGHVVKILSGGDVNGAHGGDDLMRFVAQGVGLVGDIAELVGNGGHVPGDFAGRLFLFKGGAMEFC